MSQATLVTEIVDGRRVQFYQYPDVSTFTVKQTDPEWAVDNLVTALINANAGSGVPASEPEPEPEIDEAAELMEDIIVESVQIVADQIRKAESNRLISADENALRWAEQQATMSNPWEILLGHAKRLMGKPSADRAIEYLLNQTYLAEQKLYMHPELPNLSVYLRGIVQDFLSGYDDMSREIAELKRSKQFAEAKELESGLKGSRPADVYRDYARPLRWLAKHGFQHLIGATLRRLLMDQTMPESELENPDWIEPYSGDIDPDAEVYVNIRVNAPADGELEAEAAASSESFNAEDGLESDDATLTQAGKAWAEIETDEIVKDFAWQSEVTVTDKLPDLRMSLGAVTRSLRTDLEVLATAARLAEFDTLEEQNAWISRRIRTKDSFKDFWLALKKAGSDGAAPQDLTAVSLEFQNEMCYPEVMFAHVPLVPQRGQYSTLGQWLDLFGEEMIENLLNRDPAMNMTEPSLEQIELFSAQTVDGLVEAQKDPAGKDITRTPAYLKAYYTAVINSKDLVVNGRNVAVEAGWDAWREEKSPEGNKAYKAELKNGKPPKEAMKAFWSVVNGGQVRAAQPDRVVTIAGDRSGLVLQSGRRINWRVALMKLQANELEWGGDTRERLKAALLKMGVGMEFVQAL